MTLSLYKIRAFKWLKQVSAAENFPFVVMAVLLALFHIPLKTNFGDDLMFREVWNNGRTLPWLIEYYNTASPRIFINFASIFFSGMPVILWKSVNVCVTVLAAFCISKLFAAPNACGGNSLRARNVVIAALFLTYNFYEMSSSGWVASTTNYLWPIAFALYALLCVKRVYLGKKIGIYEYPLMAAALIFAANQQQIFVILAPVYLIALICYRVHRKPGGLLLTASQISLCAASLVLILLCPGNGVRYEFEAEKFFPNHAMLTFFEKISIGVSSTFNYFVMMPNALFLVLSLLLAAGLIAKYRNPLIRAAAVTPLFINAAALLYVFAGYFMADGSFALKNPRDIFHLYGITGAQYGTRLIIPHIFYAAMIGSYIVNLYLFFKGAANNFFISIGILLLGISTRVILGFSPTVFASSYRTYLFLNLSFIITAFIIYQEIIKFAAPKTQRYINIFIVVTAAANFLALPVGYEIIKPFFNRP